MNYTVYERLTSDQRTELIYVHQGIGGPNGPWIAVYRTLTGGMHRIKAIPEANSKDEAQLFLDAYAAKKHWEVATFYVGRGLEQRPYTWEEAARV